MMRVGVGCCLAVLMVAAAGSAHSAEPIEGRWRTASGETAAIADCGGQYCITVATGPHAGKQIGKVAGSGETYSGTITDPANDRTYSGSASLTGGRMKLTGCALKIFCRSQTWTKL